MEQARVQVANLVGAQPGQVIFTSGGTEANNLAIKGTLVCLEPGRLAVSTIEHSSLLAAATEMTEAGWQLDMIPVDSKGTISQQGFTEAIHQDTRLVSVMLANNENGVIQDIESLCSLAREYGVLFHTDVSQAAGKIKVDYVGLGVNMMTLSAHKIYGPQGVGALIADRAVELGSILKGGGQERGLRSGTENIAGIVGFGTAAELAAQQLDHRASHAKALRDDLEQQLSALVGITIFAAGEQRIPNTIQFSVKGFDGEALLMQLDKKGIAVSSGSACDSTRTEPSHVLLAMGVDEDTARGAIRVSFGKDNKAEDVKQFMDALKSIVE